MASRYVPGSQGRDDETVEEAIAKLLASFAGLIGDGDLDAYPYLRRRCIERLRKVGVDLAQVTWLTYGPDVDPPDVN